MLSSLPRKELEGCLSVLRIICLIKSFMPGSDWTDCNNVQSHSFVPPALLCPVWCSFRLCPLNCSMQIGYP